MLAAIAAGADDQGTVTAERLDWMLNCQGCHLASGEGAPGIVPPIKGFAARFLGVSGGREFLIRVPGVATSPLSDTQVARLINWMLVEFDAQHLPKDFVPFTAEEVSRLRAQPLRSGLTEVRNQLVTAIESAEQ